VFLLAARSDAIWRRRCASAAEFSWPWFADADPAAVAETLACIRDGLATLPVTDADATEGPFVQPQGDAGGDSPAERARKLAVLRGSNGIAFDLSDAISQINLDGTWVEDDGARQAEQDRRFCETCSATAGALLAPQVFPMFKDFYAFRRLFGAGGPRAVSSLEVKARLYRAIHRRDEVEGATRSVDDAEVVISERGETAFPAFAAEKSLFLTGSDWDRLVEISVFRIRNGTPSFRGVARFSMLMLRSLSGLLVLPIHRDRDLENPRVRKREVVFSFVMVPADTPVARRPREGDGIPRDNDEPSSSDDGTTSDD
jgi:hypothetical protein